MPTGYGRLKWNGRESYAHRVVLEMRGVAVPPGAQVRHACHTPPCVKPDHLIVLAPGEARRPPRRASR